MATIGASVSAETKAEFDSVAHARGASPSRLAAFILEDYLKREAGNTPSLLPVAAPVLPPLASVAAAPGGAKTRQVFVRLEPPDTPMAHYWINNINNLLNMAGILALVIWQMARSPTFPQKNQHHEYVNTDDEHSGGGSILQGRA